MKQFANHLASNNCAISELEARQETLDEKVVQTTVAMLVKLSLAAGVLVNQEVSH